MQPDDFVLEFKQKLLRKRLDVRCMRNARLKKDKTVVIDYLLGKEKLRASSEEEARQWLRQIRDAQSRPPLVVRGELRLVILWALRKLVPDLRRYILQLVENADPSSCIICFKPSQDSSLVPFSHVASKLGLQVMNQEHLRVFSSSLLGLQRDGVGNVKYSLPEKNINGSWLGSNAADICVARFCIDSDWYEKCRKKAGCDIPLEPFAEFPIFFAQHFVLRENNSGTILDVRTSSDKKDVRAALVREIFWMRTLDKRPCYFLTCFAATYDSRNISVLIEYPQQYQCMHQLFRWAPLSSKKIRHIARHLFAALEWMHSLGIMHRNVSPFSVLVNVDHELPVKIVDLRYATHATNWTHPICTPVGRGMYMAPEMVRQQSYGPKVDVFSAGLTLSGLVTGKMHPSLAKGLPIFDENQVSIAVEAGLGNNPVRIKCNDNVLQAFFDEILANDPRKRPTASQVLLHKFFESSDV